MGVDVAQRCRKTLDVAGERGVLLSDTASVGIG
jgi:hypothetical protein